MVNYPCEREKLVSAWSSSVRLFTYDTVTFSTGFVNGGNKCGNNNNEGTWEKKRKVEIVYCYVDDEVLLYLPGFVTIQNSKI